MDATVNNKKSKLLIAGLGVAAFATVGLTVASAVALGIAANNELGAGTSVTATCQPVGDDIVVGFSEPAYVASTQTFDVDAVELSNIQATCDGLDIKVVVADTLGNSLGEVAGTVSGATYTATLPAAVDSAEVGSVSVVIYG